MPVTTSVIVVSYKPGIWLRPCLESVCQQSDEVIVVDNGSEGEEASAVARSVGANTVRLAKNRGFAGGFNAGWRHCRGDIVGLLNDDAVAGDNWLAAAAAAMEEPDVVAVTPKVVLAGRYVELTGPPDGQGIVHSVTVAGRDVLAQVLGPGLAEINWAAGEVPGRQVIPGRPFYVPISEVDEEIVIGNERVESVPSVRLVNHAGSFLRGHGIAGEYGFAAPDDGRFDQRAERFGFSGTAPVFRAEGLRRVGGFADAFFAYNEDTDWCLRARRAGYRIVYDPAATVTHRLSATSGGAQSQLVRFLAERNALLCLVRNAPLEVIKRDAIPRLRKGPKDQVRRSTLRHLPGAVLARLSIRRHQAVTSEELWRTWADRDTSWDQSASRPRP
jgi:GT2 family glycosyltransferase